MRRYFSVAKGVTMKKFWTTLPADVKQTACSLLISISLLCGSLFMLSSYARSIHKSDESVDAMVTPEESEYNTSPESSP